MTEEEKFEERKKYNAPYLRVFDYLAKEKLMNQGQFSKVIESESGYISLLRSGKKKVGPEYIARIAVEFAKHFDDKQHLNPDYIEGKSPYMIIENVPDDEVLEKMHRDGNPDYDVMKVQHQTAVPVQPYQPTAFDNSVLLEKAISAATAYQDRLIASLEKQIADKDEQIKDLRNDVAQRDKRIQELEAIERLYREQDPIRDWPFGTGVAERNDADSTIVWSII